VPSGQTVEHFLSAVKNNPSAQESHVVPFEQLAQAELHDEHLPSARNFPFEHPATQS